MPIRQRSIMPCYLGPGAGVFGFIPVGRFLMAVMLHTVLIMICFRLWAIDFAGWVETVPT